jgi:hypothetical protein
MRRYEIGGIREGNVKPSARGREGVDEEYEDVPSLRGWVALVFAFGGFLRATGLRQRTGHGLPLLTREPAWSRSRGNPKTRKADEDNLLLSTKVR